MYFADLQPLADRGAIYSRIRQTLMSDHLDDALGEYRWDVDMTRSELTFSSREGRGEIVTTMDLVASVAPGPRSILWGFEHPDAPGDFAHRIKAYGNQHQVASLSRGDVPLTTTATGQDLHAEIADLMHTLGSVTFAVTGVSPYYAAPLGGGSWALFILLRHPFPAVTLDHRIPLRLPDALAHVYDQRNALHSFAGQAGWRITWSADWSRADVLDEPSGNWFEARFDASARLVTANYHLHGHPTSDT